MSYVLELTAEALEDIQKHRSTGDKKVLAKIDGLLDELREHPTTGTGRPEKLKHYQEPTWSRRITGKHRLIYRIAGKKVTVLVLSLWGHYEDK